MANHFDQMAQAWRTAATAFGHYAVDQFRDSVTVTAAQVKLAVDVAKVAAIDINFLELLDEDTFKAEAARLKTAINTSLRSAQTELTTIADKCDLLIDGTISLAGLLLDIATALVRLTAFLPGTINLARHGGGGRDEYDPYRPPAFFPGSQIQPKKGDHDGGPGRWDIVWRGPKGRAYQGQIGGLRAANGRILEYRLDYTPENPNGLKYVLFDGHTWRGQPPVEIYLEAKDGYGWAILDGSQTLRDEFLARFIAQAARQLRAMEDNGVSDARLEWHFSDPEVADIVRRAFAAADELDGANIDVFYTPRV
jgi:hypothetical protein